MNIESHPLLLSTIIALSFITSCGSDQSEQLTTMEDTLKPTALSDTILDKPLQQDRDSYGLSDKQLRTITAVMTGFKKLRAKCEVGVKYEDYTVELGNIRYLIIECEDLDLPNGIYNPAKEYQELLSYFLDAKELWGWKVQRADHGESAGNLYYDKIVTKAAKLELKLPNLQTFLEVEKYRHTMIRLLNKYPQLGNCISDGGATQCDPLWEVSKYKRECGWESEYGNTYCWLSTDIAIEIIWSKAERSRIQILEQIRAFDS